MNAETRPNIFKTAVAVVVCWLTAVSLPVFGQGALDDYEPGHVDEIGSVCPWEGTIQRPELARECLRLAGINEGLAGYAFPHPPAPGLSLPAGVEAPAGVVPRWAMAEALSRVLTEAGVTLPETDREGRIVEPIVRRLDYPDIGWLTPERRAPIYQLGDTDPAVTSGFRDGKYRAEWPVDRWQMALFFVRTLRAIDRADPGNIPDLDINQIWQDLEATHIDRVRMPFPDPEIAAWKHWPEESHERYRAVVLLFDLGISYGNEEGLYLPDELVTGDQMALFIVRLLAHTTIRAGEETPPSEESLRPEVIVPTERVGNRPDIYPEGYERPPFGTPVADIGQDDPATRPPREIDYYLYRTDLEPGNEDRWRSYNVRAGDPGPMKLSRPFSIQPGDWYWTSPAGNKNRRMVVYVEFQTSGGYHPTIFPFVRAVMCTWPEGDHGNAIYAAKHYLKYAPGLYQLNNLGDISDEGRVTGLPCDMADHPEVPRPAGGYTERYPCDGTSEAVTKKWGGDLPPCVE